MLLSELKFKLQTKKYLLKNFTRNLKKINTNRLNGQFLILFLNFLILFLETKIKRR